MHQSFVITPPTYRDSSVNRGIPFTDAIIKKNIFHTSLSSRSSFMFKMNKYKVAILGFDKIEIAKLPHMFLGEIKKTTSCLPHHFFSSKKWPEKHLFILFYP